VIPDAPRTKQVAGKPRKALVVFLNLYELGVAKPTGAPGASTSTAFDIAGGRLMFAPLPLWWSVGAGAGLGLEVHTVGAGARAAWHFPLPRRHTNNLLEVLLSNDDASLVAGGLASCPISG